MSPSRAEILSLIRNVASSHHLSNDHSEDHSLLMRAGVMPKAVLPLLTPNRLYPSLTIAELVKRRAVLESPSYLIANPRNRQRPIASRYNLAKPRLRPGRRSTTYSMAGRDRLLLWYIGANPDFTGSRGESWAIWKLLQFFRTPKVQRLWRAFIDNPRFRIPPDAR